MKINERVWAGQIISWIQEEIREKRTVFQDATNDAGIKLENGKTKFPDILLFTDKISGIIFNGWELKFPDTSIDNTVLLENALEKAKRLKSDSFVTWNGAEAAIWKINDGDYSIDRISKIKSYAKESNINTRHDLSDPNNYKLYEPLLRERLKHILHDLEQLYQNDELKQAINISDNFIQAIKEASEIILPQFKSEIIRLNGSNVNFRSAFKDWKVYESSTLKILASSSRRKENVIVEEVLAKFTYYNLIGKILFYLTLSENLSASLDKLNIKNTTNVKGILESYFRSAQEIDYQAVFKPYFTDLIHFSPTVNESIFHLFRTITEFDFKVLPTEVIGTILENLVPKDEKQKFGQYFTSEILANIVSFPIIQTVNDYLFDPTSGTGTFLNSFYNILKFYGKEDHTQLINQIWGNDISHFPALLSVINLYKQKVSQTDNFPRVIRDDFFNLESGKTVTFPSSRDHTVQVEQPIPIFDAISSNFPFIQQEDIPNNVLSTFFREKFETNQKAFLKDNSFKINERSDYFTYCIYNSIRFLKPNGLLSAITSNAWLGKDYGIQFKKFLLDNFQIKYIVRSNAEHWFKDSKVSTIFFVLERTGSDSPTRFVSLNSKLDEYFDMDNIENQIRQIEDFYVSIDNCNNPSSQQWKKDQTFSTLFHAKDNSFSVNIVEKEQLYKSIISEENWNTYFISSELLAKFDKFLIKLYPSKIDSFRGERTGWNEMFVLNEQEVTDSKIEDQFLFPYVKSPTELHTIEFDAKYRHYLFVCALSMADLKKKYPGTYNWIKRFQNMKNKNGTKTIKEACAGHKPYWYTLNPKNANIVTAINPYERYFFSYSEVPFTIDQRLAGIIIDQRLVGISGSNTTNVELLTALLNSIVTFLTIELKGTSRNLGALDLNANYFKNIRVLDPDQLSKESKDSILAAFQPLKKRRIKTIFEELNMKDRIHFDSTVLKSYGLSEEIRATLYGIIKSQVFDRVNMKNK